MTTHRTGKYDYNALCDVCGWKFKASQLRKRWDGLMVCKDDWEPRNILDFYRTRQDAHRLPFTRPDDTGETTWTPTTSGITGANTLTAIYTQPDVSNTMIVEITIVPTTSITLSSCNISDPTISGKTLTFVGGTMINSTAGAAGQLVGTLTHSGSNITLPDYTTSNILLIRAKYTVS